MSDTPDPQISQELTTEPQPALEVPPFVPAVPEPEPEPMAPVELQPEITLEPVAEIEPAAEIQPVAEIEPEMPLQIPVAEPAPLAVSERSNQELTVPLQLLNQLLARFGSARLDTLADLLPALRLLALLLLAGFVLKLTGATLEALNEIPMLGRLLQLVGLISALNFLARNALRSQKRAELLTRIQKLKQDFLG